MNEKIKIEEGDKVRTRVNQQERVYLITHIKDDEIIAVDKEFDGVWHLNKHNISHKVFQEKIQFTYNEEICSIAIPKDSYKLARYIQAAFNRVLKLDVKVDYLPEESIEI